MELLTEIQGRLNIQLTIQKLESSLIDIEEKNPHRTDLIDSMEETKSNLYESLLIYNEMCNELKVLKTNIGQLNIAYLKKSVDYDKLKEKFDEFLNNY